MNPFLSMFPQKQGGLWDIANAVATGNTFNTNTQTTSGSEGGYFREDGKKLYMTGASSGIIYQYNMSTAWDVTTMTYESKSYNTTSQDGYVMDVKISRDGTKMYTLGLLNNTVYQYTLSTPWDISTASYASKSFNFNSQAPSSTAWKIFFSVDGTKMYMARNSADTRCYQYTLSTPWDISTASYASKFFYFTDLQNGIRCLYISDDGSRVLVGEGFSANDRLYQYDLTTPGDISTAVYTNTYLYVGPYFAGGVGIQEPAGGKMLITRSQLVIEYTI